MSVAVISEGRVAEMKTSLGEMMLQYLSWERKKKRKKRIDDER